MARILTACTLLLLPSCALTVAPDGTRHWTLDGQSVMVMLQAAFAPKAEPVHTK